MIDLNTFDSSIDTIATAHAYESHYHYLILSERDKMQGRLATALEFFDLIAQNCLISGCYKHLTVSGREYLEDLSVEECVRLKAYHEWRNSGKPYPTGEGQRLHHHLRGLEMLFSWIDTACCGTNKTISSILKESLKFEQSRLRDKKAYWAHLADWNRDWRSNSTLAQGYLDQFGKALKNGITAQGGL